MSSRKPIRSFLFWLHTWCGLNIVLYLGALILSGTLLSLAPEIEALFDNDRRGGLTSGPLPVGAIYDNILTEWPEARVERIERGKSAFVADHTTMVTPWGEKLLVWTNPQTGEITGLTGLIGFKYVLRIFHDSLLTQHYVGNLLVTITAPIMAMMMVTGLISYRRFWRGFFRWPSRNLNARAYWGGMHRLAALWSLPFMVIVVLTSLYFFLGTLGATSYSYPKPDAPVARIKPLPDGFAGADLQQAVAIASAEVPGLEPEMVILPIFPGQAIIVQGQAEAWFVRGRANKVTLDPSDMSVIGAFQAQELSGVTRIREAADSLHFGIWGGTFTRVLWFLFGAMLTGLCLFGAMVYARRMTRPTEGNSASALRMVWRGMFPLKWLLPLALIMGLGAGTYKYMSQTDRWSRVPAFDTTLQADGSVRLFARGKMRAGRPLPLRVRLQNPAIADVQVKLSGQDPITLPLVTERDWQQADFDLSANAGDNSVIVTLPDGTVLTWQLGHPVL